MTPGNVPAGGQVIPICSPRSLPDYLLFHAAHYAAVTNPVNSPPRVPGRLAFLEGPPLPPPLRIAIDTTKWWGPQGVHLTVGFLESTPDDLAARILSHMNAWGQYANVEFRLTPVSGADVRITRDPMEFWSFMGTDIKSIGRNSPTMCLGHFTMATPESEYRRVVRHETAHTLGCPHEHARREIVQLLDPARTIAYFGGPPNYWSPEEVRQQILTPLEESSIRGTPHASQTSVMTYEFSGECTYSRQPIPGGHDITEEDGGFIGTIYPKSGVRPPAPPDPPSPPAPPVGDVHPLILGGPMIAAPVAAGSVARFGLALDAPAEFTLLVGGTPGPVLVTAGRSGGTLGLVIPVRRDSSPLIRAPGGAWEFAVKLREGRAGLAWMRAVSFAGHAARELEPVEFA